jgi:alpha-L-fucosidase
MFKSKKENLEDFSRSRFGIFIHYGLFSLLRRGEWVLNREGIPVGEYKKLSSRFRASHFDAEKIVLLAKAAGAKYIVFTTMHHEGFALYGSEINDFNSVNSPCGRDIALEMVKACRKHGLRIHLYHSLNHWTVSPNGSDALERIEAKEIFVEFTHNRIKELVRKFNPIDCLWYDGWWPFNADDWKADEMNQMVSEIQPHIIFNGRNGLPGDFATPEQHLTAPNPWRPWEACITHNSNWGFHAGDNSWKSAQQIIDSILQVAGGAGNLLLNIGLKPDGSVPVQSVKLLESLSEWNKISSKSIFNSELFTYDLMVKGNHRGDFIHHGRYTCVGNRLYIHLLFWPGSRFSIAGVHGEAEKATLLGASEISMKKQGDLMSFKLPPKPPFFYGGILEVVFKDTPCIYNSGGIRVPRVEHPRYDPCPSDLMS